MSSECNGKHLEVKETEQKKKNLFSLKQNMKIGGIGQIDGANLISRLYEQRMTWENR